MRTALLLLPLALLACEDEGRNPTTTTDSSALEGVYEIVDAASATGNCSATPTTFDPNYSHFAIEFRNVFGFEALSYVSCDGAADCSGDFGLHYFESWNDQTASGVSLVTSFANQQCDLVWSTAVAESTGSGEVTFTLTVEEETGVSGVDLDDCIAQQEAWSGPKSCAEVQVIVGQRVD